MATKQGRILWVDAALDRLVVRPNEVDGRSMLVSVDDDGGQHAGGVYLPTAPSDCDRLLTDLAAEMGREPCEGGFRAKPRPFRVGDVVRVPRRVALRLDGAVDPLRPFGDDDLEVRGVDGAELWVRHPAGRNSTVNADACRLITPAEEVERGTEEETEAEDALRRQRQREQAVDDLYARYRRGELDDGDYEAARKAVLSAGWSA